MRLFQTILRRLLEVITVSLLIALAVVVVSAVVARYVFNASFVWYDEVASVMLAWITFYGAAYATIRRRHLGFEGLLLACALPLRLLLFIAGEIVVYAVFGLLAYAGWYILAIFGSETLISLRWVPLWFTQSVVPIGCVLVIVAQILSTPAAVTRLMGGRSAEEEEIAEEIAKAEAQQKGHG